MSQSRRLKIRIKTETETYLVDLLFLLNCLLRRESFGEEELSTIYLLLFPTILPR